MFCPDMHTPVFGAVWLFSLGLSEMSESVRTRNEIPYLSVVALELVIRTSGTELILYKN